MAKLVEFKFDRGDLESGFDVSLRIVEDGGELLARISGQLPPAPNIRQGYQDWQSDYRILAGVRPRIKVIAAGTSKELRENCRKSAQKLRQNMKEWLRSFHPEWQTIREELRGTLRQEEEVRVLIETKDPLLRQLPWQEWDIFADIYTLSEIALSFPEYKSSASAAPAKSKAKVRILAILGDSAGIDVEVDRRYLENLTDAEVSFLEEPPRKELIDRLWEEEWDILFFAGHSSSRGETGKMSVNKNESLAVKDLKNGLRKAIKGGLQLAIFNSCDGLGLARELEDLQMPQTIVMQEPVPDKVAQEFLKYFLKAFVGGKSLYLAVRYARERLHDDGLEDKYPGVTWLPVICQNPAASFLTWQDLTPEKPQAKKANGKDAMNFVLRRWGRTLDDEIKTLSQLLKRGIRFAKWGVPITLVTGIGLIAIVNAALNAVSKGSDQIVLETTVPDCVINNNCTILFPLAFVGDKYSPNFDKGQLIVTLTTNGTPDDRLSIRNQGKNQGEIGIDGSNVTYGGTVIGSFEGGDGTNPLIVNFNEKATPEVAEALVRQITYQNISDSPTIGSRTVEFQITDGDGGISKVFPIKISVTANAKENSDVSISGISISDSDNEKVTLTLETSQGKVTVKPDVAGGVSADNISGNGTNNVIINGTVAQINTTLADPDAVTYQRNISDDIVSEFVTIPEGITITKEQAVNRIKSWLQVKSSVFGRFYNIQRLGEYTTGKYLESRVGTINWLRRNNAYYTYGPSTAEAAGLFLVKGNQIIIDVKVTQNITLYVNRRVDRNESGYISGVYRWTLQLERGRWKIADAQKIN